MYGFNISYHRSESELDLGGIRTHNSYELLRDSRPLYWLCHLSSIDLFLFHSVKYLILDRRCIIQTQLAAIDINLCLYIIPNQLAAIEINWTYFGALKMQKAAWVCSLLSCQITTRPFLWEPIQ